MDKESRQILAKTEEVIQALAQTKSHQELKKIQAEMKHQKKLLAQIETVKECQKAYIRSGQTEETKQALFKAQQALESHLLYQTYQNVLEQVNQEYRMVEEKLNQFFEEICS